MRLSAGHGAGHTGTMTAGLLILAVLSPRDRDHLDMPRALSSGFAAVREALTPKSRRESSFRRVDAVTPPAMSRRPQCRAKVALADAGVASDDDSDRLCVSLDVGDRRSSLRFALRSGRVGVFGRRPAFRQRMPLAVQLEPEFSDVRPTVLRDPNVDDVGLVLRGPKHQERLRSEFDRA